MIMKSSAERYGIALLTLIVAIASIWVIWGAYSLGKVAGADAADTQHAKTLIRMGKSIDDLRLKLKAAEGKLAEVITAQDTQLEVEREHAQVDIDHRMAALRTGSVRLSVPATTGACHPARGDADPGTVADHQEARAEIDPEVAASLVSITDEGDAAIRDLNACIDRYNTVRQAMMDFKSASTQEAP